jgi:hypothetical protein
MSPDGLAAMTLSGPRIAALLAIAGLCGACGGGRYYKPTSVHEGRAPGAAVAPRVVFVPPVEKFAQSGALVIHSAYKVYPGVALTSPRLALTSSVPCESGVPAMATFHSGRRAPTDPMEAGFLETGFTRDAVDRGRLLRWDPTSLDLKVLYAEAPAGCLRVPLVDAAPAPQWIDVPTWSAGMGLRLVAPFQRIYGVDLATSFVLRFGRWLGPVRLRTELALGGALAHAQNPNLTGYSYGAGLVADYLLLSSGSFGLAATAGYDVTGISFSANIDAYSHEGAGFAGPIYGPRAGLSFAWLPVPSPGGVFRARPDGKSSTLEIFGAALSSQDRDAATGALWFMWSADLGW